MGKSWFLIGEYDSETTAFTACAGPAQTSPYTPPGDGTLVALKTIVNRNAATSLINHVQLKLTCTIWTPNELQVGAQGSGLQTAPALQNNAMDWVVNQPVKASQPIKVEGRNVTADTPVTVSVLLYGLIES